ncbi:hypothetical protein CQ046_11255 [Chryseobacterium sp. MYb7]|uniref:hypothetical protein n=1 Tax=Chryseobacterium sp. MYb7 TaxID=1827290 RepID=UPI000CFE8B82|nr:hypothetical protein [Chryseobacterium sp. MYb7]PRB02777.1 hypothetical protein CQ046_11255 [Chryseobacterium sp. MYb7]
MKKQLIIFFLIIVTTLHSQIGINTSNPIGIFHVDGAKNNPASGVPSSEQQSDDFVISKKGVVSIGTISPSPYSSLEIDSKKGLRLPQLTSEEISNLDDISSTELSKKDGLIIYNITTNCINFWVSDEWRELCGSSVCNPVTGTPQISPSNPSLQVGDTTTFTASAVSNATGYIWKVNGTIQSGQTQSTFNYTPSDTSSVTISVIAKGCNSSQTSESTVSGIPAAACNPVTGTPQISPANPSLQVGDTTTFTASAVSNATGYIWKVNGTIQSGQTLSTFNYTPSDTSSVTISVIAKGCNSSQTLESTVSGIPAAACNPVTGTPQISPANPSLQVGDTTTFTASAVSNATGYIWKVNGTVQSGQTLSTFSYIPSGTSPVTISVIATGCNNSQTSESTVSGTPTAFTCTKVGRFLKAGTNCKDYHYCHVNNGVILLNDYTCAGSTLFDKSIGNCQPTISSCPY